MSHQQLAKAAPALWVEKGSSLPVLTHGHRTALGHLGRAFAEARPVAILIGEWKSVASYIISRFLADIEGDVAVVRITKLCSNATAGMREVIQAIGFEPKDMGLADLETVFTNFLSYQRNNNRPTIICFEETQDSGWWVLDRVRRLVELETEKKFGLMVILSGRPSLNELLIRPPFDTICAHAGQRIALAPFTMVETREYISRETELAGIADIGQVFEYYAITLIHELCAGVPDTVDTLCCKCIQLAYEEDTVPVTTDLVKKVGKLLRLTSMIRKSDAGAGSVEGNGASPARGRLITRMNGVILQEQALNRGHILIGRDKLCDIRIASAAVSRLHVLIVNSSSGIKIVDLGSTNGTFVDGRLINEHALQDSDVITVGDCTIAYVTGDDDKSSFAIPSLPIASSRTTPIRRASYRLSLLRRLLAVCGLSKYRFLG